MNLKKLERYLGVNLLGQGPRLLKKKIYRAAVSQRLRNTGLGCNFRFVEQGGYLYGSHPVVFMTKFTTLIQSNTTQVYFN